MMANNYVHFDTLAKHSALNGKEHTAMLSVLVKEFQTLFPVDLYIYIDIYITCRFSNGTYRVAIRYSTQKSDHVCSPNLHKTSLTREKCPLLRSQTLLMSSLCDSTYMCEQLPRMKHRMSKISSKISGKHLESSVRIATSAIKPAWCVGFTKTRSRIPLVLWFCSSLFLLGFKKNVKN